MSATDGRLGLRDALRVASVGLRARPKLYVGLRLKILASTKDALDDSAAADFTFQVFYRSTCGTKDSVRACLKFAVDEIVGLRSGAPCQRGLQLCGLLLEIDAHQHWRNEGDIQQNENVAEDIGHGVARS